MEFILIIIVIIVLALFITAQRNKSARQRQSLVSPYHYSRKETIMTSAEIAFYRRLETIAGDRYYIFPQIHLTALASSHATGQYYKSGYQRINRRSVDYVLCDKASMKPVYAIELDDRTHDSPKRQARDTIVDEILREINLPLIRFRNVGQLTDDQIIERFVAENSVVTSDTTTI
jgi:very-short-patch-repair endonuclease